MKTRKEPSALKPGHREGKFGGSLRLWKWSLNPTLKVFTAYPIQLLSHFFASPILVLGLVSFLIRTPRPVTPALRDNPPGRDYIR